MKINTTIGINGLIGLAMMVMLVTALIAGQARGNASVEDRSVSVVETDAETRQHRAKMVHLEFIHGGGITRKIGGFVTAGGADRQHQRAGIDK